MMRLTEQQRRILEYVAANPGVSAKHIARALGISPENATTQMFHMRDRMFGTGSKIVSGYVLRSDS